MILAARSRALGIAAAAASAVTVIAASACGSFSAEPSSGDAGVGGDAAGGGEGGGPPDGAPLGEGGTSSCPSAGAVFCDDFDQPARALGVATPAPWDRSVFDGPAPTLDTGFAGRGLRMEGLYSPFVGNHLEKAIDVGGGTVTRITFRLRLDSFPDAADGGTGTSVFVAAVTFDGGDAYGWAFLRRGKEMSGYADVKGQRVDFDRPAVPLAFAAWSIITIDFEPKSGSDSIAISANGQLLKRFALSFPSRKATFALGASIVGASSAVDLRLDDVAVVKP